MADWGDPTSYLVLEAGVPVLTADQSEFGTVEHVLFDPDEDVFDGIVVKTPAGVRFVDRDQIDSINERAVVTLLSSAEADGLPAPEEAPPVFSEDPSEGSGHSLRDWYLRTFRKGGWAEDPSGEKERGEN